MKNKTKNKFTYTGKWSISNNFKDVQMKYVPAYFVNAHNVRCKLSVLPVGYGHSVTDIERSKVRAKDVAHLIGAAPEMYEALKMIQSILKTFEDSNRGIFDKCIGVDSIEHINRAIIKADGRKIK